MHPNEWPLFSWLHDWTILSCFTHWVKMLSNLCLDLDELFLFLIAFLCKLTGNWDWFWIWAVASWGSCCCRHGMLWCGLLILDPFFLSCWKMPWCIFQVMAVDMSYRLGWIEDSLVKRVHKILQQAKLPTSPPETMTVDMFKSVMAVR